MPFGTLTVLDDLDNENRTVQDFGEAALSERIAEALRIHNETLQANLADFCMYTDQVQLPYGAADRAVMMEVDEFGSADASKVRGAGNLGFPLRIYESAVQWTRLFMERNPVRKLAQQADAHAEEDVRNFHREIKRAIFVPTTYTYHDINDTELDVTVRPLLNADGGAIPNGLNDISFNGASHTHYLATTTFVENDLIDQLDTVVEHGVTGGLRIYINRAQEAAVRAFSDFERYVYSGVQLGSADSFATGATLDIGDPNNRAIGIYGGVEVSTRSWVPAGYAVVFDTGAGDDKLLALRTRDGGLTGLGAFAIRAENESHPLVARFMNREFGLGGYMRHKASVQYIGGETYVTPTFVV